MYQEERLIGDWGEQALCGKIEGFDHVVRDSENLDEKIEYRLQNPVRKGLVAKPGEYRWIFLADNLKHVMK